MKHDPLEDLLKSAMLPVRPRRSLAVPAAGAAAVVAAAMGLATLAAPAPASAEEILREASEKMRGMAAFEYETWIGTQERVRLSSRTVGGSGQEFSELFDSQGRAVLRRWIGPKGVESHLLEAGIVLQRSAQSDVPMNPGAAAVAASADPLKTAMERLIPFGEVGLPKKVTNVPGGQMIELRQVDSPNTFTQLASGRMIRREDTVVRVHVKGGLPTEVELLQSSMPDGGQQRWVMKMRPLDRWSPPARPPSSVRRVVYNAEPLKKPIPLPAGWVLMPPHAPGPPGMIRAGMFGSSDKPWLWAPEEPLISAEAEVQAASRRSIPAIAWSVGIDFAYSVWPTLAHRARAAQAMEQGDVRRAQRLLSEVISLTDWSSPSQEDEDRARLAELSRPAADGSPQAAWAKAAAAAQRQPLMRLEISHELGGRSQRRAVSEYGGSLIYHETWMGDDTLAARTWIDPRAQRVNQEFPDAGYGLTSAATGEAPAMVKDPLPFVLDTLILPLGGGLELVSGWSDELIFTSPEGSWASLTLVGGRPHLFTLLPYSLESGKQMTQRIAFFWPDALSESARRGPRLPVLDQSAARKAWAEEPLLMPFGPGWQFQTGPAPLKPAPGFIKLLAIGLERGQEAMVSLPETPQANEAEVMLSLPQPEALKAGFKGYDLLSWPRGAMMARMRRAEKSGDIRAALRWLDEASRLTYGSPLTLAARDQANRVRLEAMLP